MVVFLLILFAECQHSNGHIFFLRISVWQHWKDWNTFEFAYNLKRHLGDFFLVFSWPAFSQAVLQVKSFSLNFFCDILTSCFMSKSFIVIISFKQNPTCLTVSLYWFCLYCALPPSSSAPLLLPRKGGIRCTGKNASAGEFLIGNHTAHDKDSFWRSRDH